MIIIFLRAKSDEFDAYEDAFSNDKTIFVPVLQHSTINEKLLADNLFGSDDKYLGVIITSQRAVEALEKAVISLDPEFDYNFGDLLKDKPIYVTGPATAKAVRRIGLTPVGEDSGSSSTLVNKIISDFTSIASLRANSSTNMPRPLIYLVGDKRRDTIPNELKSNNIPFDELLVYGTQANGRFPIVLNESLSDPIITESLEYEEIWIVFFSPSGVDVALPELRCQSWFGKARIASIGPTTTGKLLVESVNVDCQAEKPAAESLKDCINRVRNI